MIALAFAASLGTGPVIARDSAKRMATRYLQMEMRVQGYGIHGGGEMIFDRLTGRFVQRLSLGPASQWIGFDGKGAWFADATGLPITEGNVDQRSAILLWSKLFCEPSPASMSTNSVRYEGLSRTATVTIDPSSHLVKAVSMPRGNVALRIQPSKYREVDGGLTIPFRIAYTDDNGTWIGDVTKIEATNSVSSDAFARPKPPRDASLTGTTSVRFAGGPTLIVMPARINGGPVMHFVLDTGGQNVLTPAAAKRLHVPIVGGGTVGGGGAALVTTRFASVSSIRIGSAEMRNQPFLVIDLGGILPNIDGIMGYELFSRFATRIDYANDTLDLSTTPLKQWIAGTPATPFEYVERQPQVSGKIDGLPSTLTIDTGSTGSLDLNAPFAQKHDLWKHYNAALPKLAYKGVGGGVKASPIVVKSFVLGSANLVNVPGTLAQAAGGVETDPSIDANVGEGVIRGFSLVLDYPNQQLYFMPGGLHDRSGITIAPRETLLVVASVHPGTEAAKAGVIVGMTLTRVNGIVVTARDLDRVRAQLRGPRNSRVLLTLNGTRHVHIRLTDYL